MKFETTGDKLGVINAVFFTVCYAVLPFLMFYKVTKTWLTQKLEDKNFQKNYGTFVKELKINENKSFFSIHQWTLFICRRYLFCAILMYGNTTTQIITIRMSSLLMAIYIGYWQPFEDRSTQAKEITNEILLIVFAFFLPIFTDNVEKNARFKAGICMLIMLVLVVLYQVLLSALETYSSVKQRVRQFLWKRKMKKYFKQKIAQKFASHPELPLRRLNHI